MLQLVDGAQAATARGAVDEDVQKFLTKGVAHTLFLARTRGAGFAGTGLGGGGATGS